MMTRDEVVAQLNSLPGLGRVQVLAEDGSILEVTLVEGEAQPDGSYVIWLRGVYVE